MIGPSKFNLSFLIGSSLESPVTPGCPIFNLISNASAEPDDKVVSKLVLVLESLTNFCLLLDWYGPLTLGLLTKESSGSGPLLYISPAGPTKKLPLLSLIPILAGSIFTVPVIFCLFCLPINNGLFPGLTCTCGGTSPCFITPFLSFNTFMMCFCFINSYFPERVLFV